MVSKNNQWQHLRTSARQVPHYGLRKLSVGVASVLLSTTLYMGVSAHADAVVTPGETTTTAATVTTSNSGAMETTGQATGSGANVKPNSGVMETTGQATGSGVNAKPNSGVTETTGQATGSGANVKPNLGVMETTGQATGSGVNAKPNSGVMETAGQAVPSSTVATSENPVDSVADAKFVSETPASNATQNETIDSLWIIRYVDQADHKKVLKAPTSIEMQYTRTNTPQSDGTTKYGDWSYVPGSYEQTGTPIIVKDGTNPVKQDNIDKDGVNMDVFTISAVYPTIKGYTVHDGLTGIRLHDELRNDGTQSNKMIVNTVYVEYDVAKERSVTVKFVDSQDFNRQVGQAIMLTGRDGDTVNLNLTVPDKYQLANGQQLPTTYTFTPGSGNVTIHLVHKVVQREATVNVKLLMKTGVDIDGVDGTRETITQERWKQRGEEFNAGNPESLYETLPLVEVGTLTGHVNYDVVDSKVVSFGDDWTTLNLGGHTYQLPNGVDVVNGVLIDSDDGSLGKPLREYYLEHYSIVNPGHSVDPDYATRPWHGYLSVNATNDPNSPLAMWNFLGLQGGLAGNEPNALAKATGDRAATAVEMANKTIDVSLLEQLDFGPEDMFSEQNGQLQGTLPVMVAGVYVPYVEKTATRTINVTTPDGKTTTVRQTATLEKQVDLKKDAHPAWTTDEWTSYDVPVIPGYTASQLNVAKEAVTGTTKDQIVNITYAANKQSTTVVYQTEDGTPVHTTTVNGQTGQTVKVPNEVPVGWKVINGKVPSEITFEPNGTPQTVVTIAHQHVAVDPDHPQNNGTKLPDNPAKSFSGVEANDLNKTITRTVKVTTPDGQTKVVAQTAKLTRTADVDEVTGEVTYGKWTTGKWDAYEISTVPGYTASQNEVPATEVTSDTTDQTFNVSYTASSQTIHINYVDDNTRKIVNTITITGKTGDTVNLNLTVPDKYQLANGQQLPTTYTFAAGSRDVTIYLAHKVVQREASVDVQVGLVTLVYVGDEIEPGTVVTQNQWRQLDDEIKDSKNPNSDKVFPLVKVGTLTGHVNYDLVDNKVVSVADGWTSLNLGSRTYQMPDGIEVVNGVMLNNTDSWGKKFKERLLKYHPDADPDYVNRVWHGYLSVNETNMTAPDFTIDSLQSGLVGNEPNTLAKAIGDQAATAVKTTDKTIDSNWLKNNFSTFEFSEQDGQLRTDAFALLVGVYIPYVEKTVTRTINVTVPGGKITTVKQTATLEKQVDFGKDAHPDWTTGEWTSYNVPTIPGYTASQSNVAKEVVTGVTKDQTVNIIYIANPQTTTVVYQTEDGTSVHTTMVNGQTGQTVKVSSEVPAGWVITKGEVPSEITFGPNGTPQTVVTIAHQHVTVDPDHPQTNGTKLPDNPAKTFEGVEVNDLNKIITRTIKVTTPDGQTKTVAQTAKLTRTADVDEVTGEVTYGQWTTGKWSNYDVPTVPGYTASQDKVPATEVTSNMTDQTIDVYYTANSQTTHINYIDDAGKILHTTTVTGKTDQTVKVPNEVPAGWMITKGEVPSEVSFGPNGHADETIMIGHQHVTVDPDHPQNNGTKLPDNPAKTFNGVEANDLNKTITRTIKVTTPDGKTATTTQTAKLTRTASVDEVTGEVAYGNWTTGQWNAYDAPSVAGYTPNQVTVAKESVTAASKDTTVEITYSPMQHQISVEYVDDDDHGKVVKTDQVPGKTDQTITVTPSAPANYDLVDNGNHTYTVTSDDAQAVQIHVKHHQVTTSESKIVTRTINVHTPHDGTKVVKQTAELTRKVTIDQVTGNKTYGDWTTGQWEEYTPEAIPGYTPSTNEVPNANVDGNSKNQMVDLTYTADTQKVEIVYVDDTKGGAVVKTDQVVGKTDETVKVTPDVPAGYELVGKVPGDYTMTANGHQTITVHLVHQMKTASESKTVTRTIDVHTPHDGTKVVKQTAKLTRDVTTDQVTGEKTYGDWSTAAWDRYAVPAVAGYVPSIEQVAQQVVNGTTKDQTIDVTYSSGEHTTHINYVDGAGNAVHTTTITGRTDGTVQVPNETLAGWTVVGEPVPTELAFGPDGHADVTVTIDHQHVTVTPDQPKTPTDKLPDNPVKTYPNGVGHDDLNKTVTRTIKVTTPGGQTKTVAQTVKLTRTADVDEVTSKVTYGGWTTGEWSSYEVPAVPGYTASQIKVPAAKVTDETKDQMVTVTYTANDQTTHINYVDNNGKIVHTTTITGRTDQTVKVPNEVPTGWKITSGQVPNEITFGANGHSDVTVTVDHQHVTVTPDRPQPDGTPLPDNPSQTFHGVTEINLNKVVTRTIEVAAPARKTITVKQAAKLTRTADVDEVTGEVTYGAWSTGNWDAYQVPVVPGYMPSQSEVPAEKVTDTMKNQTVTVTYTANDQVTHVNYVDGNGKIVHTTTVTGKTDQIVKVPNEVPTGWKITSGQVPNEITFGADGHAPITVAVVHQHVTVTPDQPRENGTKLPDNDQLTFNGVGENDLNKVVTRTIEVTTPAGKTDTITQTVKLTRTADVDEVTGKVTYGTWSTGNWDAYQVPALKGYTASQTTVAATPVTSDTSSQTVKITYTADQGTVYVNYVDEAGHSIHTTTVTGTTGQTVKVPKEVPAGWVITKGDVPTTVTVNGDETQTITITVQHRTVTVEPNQPQPDGTPLPDNPSQHFTGVESGDLNKTITRTIIFNVPGQDPRTITQTAKVIRTATVDEVTGEVTYGDWTTAQWPAVTVPAVDGYTTSQTQIPAVTVGPKTDNQTVTVDYQAVEVPTTPTTTSEARPMATSHTSGAKSMATPATQTKLSASAAEAPAAKASQLPQTGADEKTSAVMTSLGLLMGTLSAYALGHKKKNKGRKA